MNSLSKSSKHKFWKDFQGPVAVAHRGGDAAGTDKESSRAAFKTAYKLGYRWFEADVVATRDKKLIVSHGRGWQLRPNKDLPTRTRLGKMRYADIKRKVKIGDEPVMLFEDLLEEFPDVKIFVDPKTFASVPVLINLLSGRPNDIDRVCIGAFSKMRTFRTSIIIKNRADKEACTSLLGPINAYPIYLGARFKALRIFAKYYAQETGSGSIHVPYRWITGSPKAGSKLINFAHQLGLKVAVYTPNTEKNIESAIDSGVDVVMSDKIKLLSTLIKSKNKK
jgi:glycerophosphoryl diester phosphodiesterase